MIKMSTKIPHAAREIISVIRDSERLLAESILPECRGSNNPRDHVRLATAQEQIRRYCGELMRTLMPDAQECARVHKEAQELVAKAKEEILRMVAEINQLKSDLRSAQELRGLNESKKVKEIEAELAKADRELMNVRFTLNEREQAMVKLESELVGKDAALAGYQRDIAQLTTASANNAAKIAPAVAALESALEKIAEKWAKPTPLVQSIMDDIAQAKELLK